MLINIRSGRNDVLERAGMTRRVIVIVMGRARPRVSRNSGDLDITPLWTWVHDPDQGWRLWYHEDQSREQLSR